MSILLETFEQELILKLAAVYLVYVVYAGITC